MRRVVLDGSGSREWGRKTVVFDEAGDVVERLFVPDDEFPSDPRRNTARHTSRGAGDLAPARRHPSCASAREEGTTGPEPFRAFAHLSCFRLNPPGP